MMAFSGVRSSWLMFARNRLLAWLASTACSSARLRSATSCSSAALAMRSCSSICSRNCSASRLRRMTSDRATNAQPNNPSTMPPDGTMIQAFANHGGTMVRCATAGVE